MTKRILLLEDEEIFGDVYSRFLREADFDVTWCKTTKDARQTIGHSHVDGIILDHGIKEEAQSGMMLIPLLKKKFPKAKIIMLSNYSPFDIGSQAIKAGADAYRVKLDTPPMALVTLLKKLLLEEN